MGRMLAIPTFGVKQIVGDPNPRPAEMHLRALATSCGNELVADPSIGSVIKTLRKQRGLTQIDLAAAIGWERSTIAAVERGHDKPGRDLVDALASFFDTTADHILNRAGKPEPKAAQTEAEAELLKMFREASDTGKVAILATLRALTHSGH